MIGKTSGCVTALFDSRSVLSLKSDEPAILKLTEPIRSAKGVVVNANLPIAQEELLKWTPQQQLELLGQVARMVMARQSAPTLTIDGDSGVDAKVLLLTEFPQALLKTFTPGSDDRDLQELNRLVADPKNRAAVDDFAELASGD